MIERDDIEKVRSIADGGELCPPPPKVLRELCRVYLAWMEAPEVDELSESNLCDLGAISDEAYSLIGKRVRLVEVKE